MSADNRILIHQEKDGLYHVWEGSCSYDYHSAPPASQTFKTEDEARIYAIKECDSMSVCEGGVQFLTESEMIRALRQELEMSKNPVYCPECDACGEEGCCSGSRCKKNKCLYGEAYSRDFLYYKDMTCELYECLEKIDKSALETIFNRVYDKHYTQKNENIN